MKGDFTKNYDRKYTFYFKFRNGKKGTCTKRESLELFNDNDFYSQYIFWIQKLYRLRTIFKNLVVCNLFLPWTTECKNNSYIYLKKSVWTEIRNSQWYKRSMIGNRIRKYLQLNFFNELFLYVHCKSLLFRKFNNLTIWLSTRGNPSWQQTLFHVTWRRLRHFWLRQI